MNVTNPFVDFIIKGTDERSIQASLFKINANRCNPNLMFIPEWWWDFVSTNYPNILIEWWDQAVIPNRNNDPKNFQYLPDISLYIIKAQLAVQ